VSDNPLAADLGFSEALRARSRGFNSIALVIRIAVAVTLANFIALRFSNSVLPIFAPVTALLVVQGSAFSTIGLLAQRVLGTGLGVAAATLYVTWVPHFAWMPLNWTMFFIAVLASLLIARKLPLGLAGQAQIPVAVVFVLALGPGDLGRDLWRVVDVVIGAVVGLIVVLVSMPRPRLTEAYDVINSYIQAIGKVLSSAASEIGTHAAPLPETTRHAFIGDARALLANVAKVGEAMTDAVESVRFNPRARSAGKTLESLARRRRWALILATQTRALVGSIDRLYDRAGHPVGCPPTTLVPLLHELVELLDVVAADGVGPATEARDAALAEKLREAVAATTEHRDVADVLESVTVLGRVDALRALVARGPMVERLLDPDEPDPDAEDELSPGERARRLLRRD